MKLPILNIFFMSIVFIEDSFANGSGQDIAEESTLPNFGPNKRAIPESEKFKFFILELRRCLRILVQSDDLNALQKNFFKLLQERSDLLNLFLNFSKKNKKNFLRTLEVLKSKSIYDPNYYDPQFFKIIGLSKDDFDYIMDILQPSAFFISRSAVQNAMPLVWHHLQTAFMHHLHHNMSNLTAIGAKPKISESSEYNFSDSGQNKKFGNFISELRNNLNFLFTSKNLYELNQTFLALIQQKRDLFNQFSKFSKKNQKNLIRTLEVLKTNQTTDFEVFRSIGLDKDDFDYIANLLHPFSFIVKSAEVKKAIPFIWKNLQVAFLQYLQYIGPIDLSKYDFSDFGQNEKFRHFILDLKSCLKTVFLSPSVHDLQKIFYALTQQRKDLFYNFSRLPKRNQKNLLRTLEVLKTEKTADLDFFHSIGLEKNNFDYIVDIIDPLSFPVQDHAVQKATPFIWKNLQEAFLKYYQ
ncbi:hypothetical protein K737_300737 [Holospora undulata HU1]|uniref:Uncharacterized protein n=2 Tax=Holospora TaxID=44747 RepID=A0A061JHM5_9PROT|nr:hypothetical protein K737_300737 [Holospora undulata HU1]